MNLAEPVDALLGACAAEAADGRPPEGSEAAPGRLRVSAEQVREARAAAAGTQRRLVQVLEERCGWSPERFASALASTLGYPLLTMAELHRLAPAFDVLPFAEAAERECLPLRDAADGGALRLVFGDPFDIALQAWAEQGIPEPFTWCLAHRRDVAAYLARHEGTLRAMDSLSPAGARAPGPGQGVEELSIRTISEDASPVVKLVNSTIYDALQSQASDIHLETGPTGLAIKYRVDGVLAAVGSMDGAELAEQVVSRIKVMSELDIAERRVPQDGRFKISVRGREVDFRVSVMPSIFGEDAVLRILDKRSLSDQLKELRLDGLGFDEHTIALLRRLCNEPYGMLLVTGPTGSGKTTTLYAAITEINQGRDKIVTIEDPVEYQ
jgi:general secretion pathway protein E